MRASNDIFAFLLFCVANVLMLNNISGRKTIDYYMFVMSIMNDISKRIDY